MSEKVIVLVDGENLIFRYQEMLNNDKALIPRENTIHEKDVVVWHNSILQTFIADVLRVSYYSTLVGDDDTQEEVKQRISRISYTYRNIHDRKKSTLNPHYFKKEKRAKKTKSVDINLTIDALRHTYNDSVDVVYLLSGDGDYLPLIEEIMRQGKQAWIGAFSSGCNSGLKFTADKFISLDKIFFQGKDNISIWR